MSPEEATVRTPATMGNFGPGFDVTSLALDWGGDTLTAMRLDAGMPDEVVMTGRGSDSIPASWQENAAALGFEAVRSRLGEDAPVRLHVEKGTPPGSGLGSSASSAAGGVLVALRLFRPTAPWDPAALLQAALSAESGKHGDDVAAALLGGLAMVREGECMRWDPPEGLALAIVRPELGLSTREMRRVVPEQVPMSDAVGNMAQLAFLLSAWNRGDVRGVARSLDDRLAAPHRRAKIPFHDVVQAAARAAGAVDVAISGSGPAMFSVADGIKEARDVAGAMAQAVEDSGTPAEAIACFPESRHVWKEALE